jgi:ABC-type dipeptide/oligopeptide/nickel transport system permease subunit
VSAEAAEQARKAAAAFSVFTALSLLIGAFIGCVAGALGGYLRDEV